MNKRRVWRREKERGRENLCRWKNLLSIFFVVINLCSKLKIKILNFNQYCRSKKKTFNFCEIVNFHISTIFENKVQYKIE